MSVLINGMEMPKTCDDCPLLDWDLSYIKCGVVNRKFTVSEEHFKESRAYDCPLVEVPPHGRLIDADALTQDGWALSRVVPVDGVFTSQEMPINCKSVPTIIKAEGGRVNGF